MLKTVRASSKLENFPTDLISSICLFFETPDVVESLLTVNKHFHTTICSSHFFGSVNIIFPVGLKLTRLTDRLNFRDDPLMSRVLGLESSESVSGFLKSVLKTEKRCGIKDAKIKNRSLKQMNYVRNIRVVEVGVYYDNEMMKKVIDIFPRLIGLYIHGMLHIRDDLFTNYIFGAKCLPVRKLDICGCDELTDDIFFTTNFLRDHLEELHIGGGNLLKDLLKKKKCLTFNRLKKVVIKSPFSGCNWNRPSINTMEFHNLLHADTIEEFQFLHVEFEKVNVEEERRRPYFLEHFKNLKKVKLLDPLNVDLSILKNIPQLEVADFCFRKLSDPYFDNFPNLRKLRLRGGVQSSLTKNIFPKLPRLTHLDLRNFEGMYLYKPDGYKKLSDEEITFFRGLKSLRLCCRRTNIAEELRLLRDDSSSKVLFPCLCSDFIRQKGLGDHVEEKDTSRYVHYMCSKCDLQTKGCEKCGKLGMDVICKIKTECFACKKYACCSTSCEKCSRSFCPCTKVTFQMPFCSEGCGYEGLCEDCVAELSRCERCRGCICTGCSSRCIRCHKLVCEERCIKSYTYDDDDYDEGNYVPRDERICLECKKKE